MNSVQDDPRWAGFPHSDICGSKGARASPQLFAACHVLHRLSVPRHPPNALLILDRSRTRHAQTQKPIGILAQNQNLNPGPDKQTRPRPCTTSHLFLSDGHSRHEQKTRVYIGEIPRPSHKPTPDLKRLATYSQCHKTLQHQLNARQKLPKSNSCLTMSH